MIVGTMKVFASGPFGSGGPPDTFVRALTFLVQVAQYTLANPLALLDVAKGRCCYFRPVVIVRYSHPVHLWGLFMV